MSGLPAVRARAPALWRIRLHLYGLGAWSVAVRLLRHRSAALGLVLVVLFLAVTIFAPWVAPFDPRSGAILERLRPPAGFADALPGHVLGTDGNGRDILSRILFGGRVSFGVGTLATLFSVLLGILLGAAAGYYRGAFDAWLSRFGDLLMAFPFLIFAIGLLTILGPGFWNMIFALSFKGWVEFYRLVRGEVMAERGKEYVEAARALGLSPARILVGEVLPNVLHSVMVLATLRVGYMITMEATLSFLGLGVDPRTPAWGSMIYDGYGVMLTAWWVATFPGVALALLVLGINLVGEGLRDVLDPRLKTD